MWSIQGMGSTSLSLSDRPGGTLLRVTANCPFSPVPFSTADISVQLQMDTTNPLQEIQSCWSF